MSSVNIGVRPSVTVMFPVEVDSFEPVEVRSHDLVAGVVSRENAAFFGGSWKANTKEGVYVLLSDLTDGGFDVYVGYTSGDFQQRFTRDHLRTKDYWSRAIMFVPASEHGLSSTEALWLEGHLVDIFAAASNACLHNKKATGDRSVREADLFGLHRMTESIMRVLLLLGYTVKDNVRRAVQEEVGSVDVAQSATLAKPVPVIAAPPVVRQETVPAVLVTPAEAVVSTSDVVEKPQKKGGLFGRLGRKDVNKDAGVAPKKVFSDEEKFTHLKKWRLDECKKFSYNAAYLVFDDLTLKEIIKCNPLTKRELIQVSGVGPIKVEKHGETLLTVMKAFN
jgi:hypothetical protein